MNQKSSGSLKSLVPSSSQSTSSLREQECIQVSIRLRPLLRPQEDEEAWNISRKLSTIYSIVDQKGNLRENNDKTEGMSLKDKKRLIEAGSSSISFCFDNLEDSDVRTQSIYNKIGKHIVVSVMEGYHGSILCYGQTTSGKTFTMLGSPENPGILPCSVRDLFGMIQKRSQDEDFNIWISYMEIYNENIHDLLSPSATNLKIVEDVKWGTVVQGVKMQRVWNFEQAIVLMNYGEEHRIYRQTSVSEHSSRSHTVFKVVTKYDSKIRVVSNLIFKYVESYKKEMNEGFNRKRYSCLNLVDLAGSERLSETENNLNTVGETGYINKSLFVLANCINKLAENKKQHIPYRDSKLTRILSQALGGNSYTTIICCVSPAVCNFNQTLSTLRFATRAKIIQNKPIINEIGNDTSESGVSIEEYKRLEGNLDQQVKDNHQLEIHNEELKQELAILNNRLTQLSSQEKHKQQLENIHSTSSKSQFQNEECDTPGADWISSPRQLQNSDSLRNNGNIQRQSTPPLASNEMNYLDQILIQLNPMLSQSLSCNQNNLNLQQQMDYFTIETSKISMIYKKELIRLQQELVQGIKRIIGQICQEEQQFKPILTFIETLSTVNSVNIKQSKEQLPKPQQNQQVSWGNEQVCVAEAANQAILDAGRQLLSKIQNKSVFESIKFSFMEVISLLEQYDQYEQGDQYLFNLSEKLKLQYEGIQNLQDECYEKARNGLEYFYRKQISQPMTNKIPSLNSISLLQRVTQEHETQLNSLRHLYEQERNRLDQAFAATLKMIQETTQKQNNMKIQQYENNLIKNNKNYNNNSNGNNFYSEFSDYSHESHNSSSEVFQEHNVSTDNNQFIQSSNFNNMSMKQQQMKHKSSRSFNKSTINVNKLQQIPQRSPNLGILYVWGSGKDGRLGIEGERPQKYPTIIQNIRFCSISLGYHHSSGITAQGYLFTWGRGSRGQLGHGNFENASVPTKVQGLKDIVSVCCGWQHSLALSSDGKVFSWGFGEDGQLGHGDLENQWNPKQIQTFDGLVTQISVGHSHSAIVTDQGKLLTFGCNVDHRLMTSNTNPSMELPSTTELEGLRLEYGDDYQVVGLSLGVNHTVVVTANGNLYTAGLANDGQLGSFISEDMPNALIIQRNMDELPNSFQDEQETSGFNINNLSNNNNNNDLVDKICYFNKVRTFHSQNKAVQVAAGDSFTLVLSEHNQVYSFGKGSYNRLGHTDIDKNQNIYEPKIVDSLKNIQIQQVAAGCRHSVAISQDGKLFSWGFNFYDQLGLGDSQTDFQKPTKVNKLGGLKVKQACCGYFHTAALIV